MSDGKCTVAFYETSSGEIVWTCRKFLMCATAKIPLRLDRCYAYKCSGRREYIPPKPPPMSPQDALPPQSPQDAPLVMQSVRLCEAPNCKNPLERETQLKFCSRKCGNRDRKIKSRIRKKIKEVSTHHE